MSNLIFEEARRRTRQRLVAPADPYTDDPAGWAKHRARIHLWSKQVEIAESVRDNRYTSVKSCHGAGKSLDAAVIANWWIDVHPPGEAFIVTTAPTDSQVKAILWRLISRIHRRYKGRGRTTLDAKWYSGRRQVDEELIGFGRKPQDYDEAAFQGIHAKYVLVLIDEACGVNRQLWTQLETLLTNEYSRLLAIGNPDDPASHFATTFDPTNGDYNNITIKAWDTPNFTGEAVPQQMIDELVSPLWVNERRTRWGVGSPLWMSKVEAEFPRVSFDNLIQPGWIMQAKLREIAGLGLGNYGLDVARYGADETVMYRQRDGRIRMTFHAHQMDTVETSNLAAVHLLGHGANFVPCVVDESGIGGAVVDNLRAKNLNVIGFNGGMTPFDGIRFRNRRAEAYWNLRDVFENDQIDIDPNDEDLINQLQSLKWKVDRNNRIIIESKDDMRRRGLPSPDRADAAMMCFTTLEEGNAPIIIPIPQITSGLLREPM